jgi:hypothetical protein
MNRHTNELVGAAFVAGTGFAEGSPTSQALRYERPRLAHKLPKRSIRLDGEIAKPRAVQAFDGMPLYYILDKAAFGGGEIAVFSTADQAGQYRERSSNKVELSDHRAAQVNLDAANTGGYVTLHENADYGGASWTFWARWGNIPDFRKVFPVLWWTTNINDRVSSVDTNIVANPAGTKVWTVLYQHINFEGSQLWISNDDLQWFEEGPGLVRDLGILGWNDIASSMSYEG